MKAMTLTQIKQPLELQQRDPLQPGEGDVVVQLKAAALNRRDYWITVGLYPGIKPPVVLGSDGAGIVTRCGVDVDSGWIGREVIINPGLDWGDHPSAQQDSFQILGLPTDGTFATEVRIPVNQVHEKPEHLAWSDAAALPLAGSTAYRALFTQGDLQASDNVLITGIGGGVATFALQFAVASGASVWVTSSSESKIQRALELGAKGGFNYRDENWVKNAAAEAGQPNVIIDSAGGPGYAALLELAAPGGRIVNYGSTAGPPETLDMFKLFWKQLRLQGTTMGSPDDFENMLKLVKQHQLHPIIDASFPLEEANQAIEQMKSSPQFGKYVLAIE
ncbi:MAG: quinone oxidoreductase family protein [Rubripirellula sp.]